MPLSQKQMEYLALAWQCFESEPKVSNTHSLAPVSHPFPYRVHKQTDQPKQIDYNKFYQVAGLASANSARELMRVTKNKLKTEYGALSGSVQSSNNAGTPSKKGGANGTKSASGTPGATLGPSGKKRGRKGVSAAEGTVHGEVEDDAEESPTKKGRKGSVTPAVKMEREDEWLQ